MQLKKEVNNMSNSYNIIKNELDKLEDKYKSGRIGEKDYAIRRLALIDKIGTFDDDILPKEKNMELEGYKKAFIVLGILWILYPIVILLPKEWSIISFGLFCGMFVTDRIILKKLDWHGKWTWWGLVLTPVYLFFRCRRTDKKYYIYFCYMAVFIIVLLFTMFSACDKIDRVENGNTKVISDLSIEEKMVVKKLSALWEQLEPKPASIAGTIEYWKDASGDDFILYYTYGEKLYSSTINVNNSTVINHGLVLTKHALIPKKDAPVIYIDGEIIADRLNLTHVSFEKFVSSMNYSFEKLRDETAERIAKDAIKGMLDSQNKQKIKTENFDILGKTNSSFESFVDGTWWDLFSQRCNLEMNVIDDETVKIEINWSSGAAYNTVWNIIGKWDADDRQLNYVNGIMNSNEWIEGQEEPNILRSYTDGSGYFYFKNGYLYWVDNKENAGKDCYFEPPSELY